MPGGGARSPSGLAGTSVWRGTSKGFFTVKNAYYMQKEKEELVLAGSSLRDKHSLVWRTLWALQIPNPEKIFLWRACKEFYLPGQIYIGEK